VPPAPGPKKHGAVEHAGPHVPRFARQFLKRIEDFDYVRQVTLDCRGGMPSICTVIEAPRLDDTYTFPIYDAEGDVLRANPDLLVDFRLINRSMGANQTGDYGSSNPPDGVTLLLQR
jgi:hypothetical protein